MTIFQFSAEYLARQKRLEDAFNLRIPDRVPVAPAVIHYYPTLVKNISNKDAMYQWDIRLETIKELTVRHDWDAAPAVGSVGAARPWELMGIQQVKWPGGALSDNQPFQWVEKEYMLQSEYDDMLADPNGFALKTLWPRIAATMEPLSRLAQIGASLPLLPLSNAYALPNFIGEMILNLGLQDFLERILKLSREIARNNELATAYNSKMLEAGYPVIVGANSGCAFDWISSNLRGMRGVAMDMYQVPDKLLATIDMLTPLAIRSTIMMTQRSGIKTATLYLHRGSAGFMSDAQFAKFYWPGLKALVLGLIEAGIRPIIFTEGNYTPRLKYFQELPPRKFVMHYQEVDRKLAKQMLGDIACFWGNVPSGMMCTGTPEQVEDDVKELIQTFAANGGLIVAGQVVARCQVIGSPRLRRQEGREDESERRRIAVHQSDPVANSKAGASVIETRVLRHGRE